MDQPRKDGRERLFNAHTGSAFGLVIGISLGSLLTNLAPTGIGGLPHRIRSALESVVGSACGGPAAPSLLALALRPDCGQTAVARPAAGAAAAASVISAR